MYAFAGAACPRRRRQYVGRHERCVLMMSAGQRAWAGGRVTCRCSSICVCAGTGWAWTYACACACTLHTHERVRHGIGLRWRPHHAHRMVLPDLHGRADVTPRAAMLLVGCRAVGVCCLLDGRYRGESQGGVGYCFGPACHVRASRLAVRFPDACVAHTGRRFRRGGSSFPVCRRCGCSTLHTVKR